MSLITTNTIWTTNSVIDLSSDIQIANGATLTVQSGVTINANGHNFMTGGTLIMQGSSSSAIQVNNASFIFGVNYATPGYIKLSHVHLYGGSFLTATGNASYGYFNVSDSFFSATEYFCMTNKLFATVENLCN